MSIHDLVITRWGARFLGRQMPCAIGRGGIGVKLREGDGITPIGRWNVERFLVRPDRVHLAGAAPIGLRDTWCDDPDDPAYNQLIRQDGPSDESLRRGDAMYNMLGVLDYNMHPVIPGAGCAIFLHVWRRPGYPTAGCVALSHKNMHWIVQNWQGGQVVIS